MPLPMEYFTDLLVVVVVGLFFGGITFHICRTQTVLVRAL